MENQGYEEDQSRAAQEQSTLESRRRDQQLCTDTIDVIDNPVVARATSHPESNLYEDIAIGAETNTSELSKRTSYPDESRNLSETGGLLARQAWINRPSSSTIDRPFQQNSTLSSRISTNHDSIITLSRTSEDDAEKVFEKSRELPSLSEDVSENVSLSLQANEDSQDASMTQFDRRPNRRRRKKDCKHCRSKLADVSSCEKFDELIDSKDTILKENGDNHRDRHPDASTLLFRESLLRPQNIKVYPIVSRTSLRDIGAKRSSSAAFPASERAYSLPARTHTPTSQNRANLRRSVRNEPPPQPARLDKHRRGWTLHLARPLKASGCSSPLIPLLIVVLILLGVAGVALYIVFEPEKLQIIQQYLKSSTSRLTGQNVTSGEPITPTNDESNLTTAMTDTMTLTSMTDIEETFAGGMFAMSAPISGNLSFPGSTSPSNEGLETEAASQNVINATRYCDDCFEGELCVAIFGEMVPICRKIRDHSDPTGCGGFCILNRQKCHRLDMDAFRCERVERFFCLENEWTCSNTLCIPLDKRCDGHMNCYDHSDEYDCVCNLETHFQCGNKTSCLPLERRCDRKIDCWDATDEINCTLVCSLEAEFTCINGECIQRDRFCDGLADCSDGTDEPHGCQGRCNKHEFTCQNSRCIAKRMKCNGFDDCGDGSDEIHCKDRFI
ncbi:Low-density lipoprotein receptor-related protein 2 [Acromyrmex echinatior]|uniref:Low-density lipoprotein receptor-related protein 2 n=1 Tax=Acromyrmex echinatior TaxID=103372 RepID=F4X1S2_ACREC|nr:Low-density lipoprotein receptor-related protein 2 [Acromyrmex echinatior]